MRVTKKSVLINGDTRNTHGLIEDGCVCDRLLAYRLEDVLRISGVTVEQLKVLRQSDWVPGLWNQRFDEFFERNLEPKVIRRGWVEGS